MLENINLTVGPGEFVALVGPSGCGKTTLLNLLSGYEEPTSGTIERPASVRRVYQQDGLLPWLTVRENIALGKRDQNRDQDRNQNNANTNVGSEKLVSEELVSEELVLEKVVSARSEKLVSEKVVPEKPGYGSAST